MEVMVGSSFGIGMAAYVRDRGGVSAQDKTVPAALFLAEESGRGGNQIGLGRRIGLRVGSKSVEDSSDSSSSSIGESSDNEEEDNDAVSSQGGVGGGLDSFSSSLEDSLPIKRGLSNHYVGKSKSFGNLMGASNSSNAKDLEKTENPLNKRRRLLIANKLRRRERRSSSVSNFYSWQNPNSMPLLVNQESNEGKDDDQTIKILQEKKKRELMGQTRSCFCLSRLEEEHGDDDDDDDDDENGNDDDDENDDDDDDDE